VPKKLPNKQEGSVQAPDNIKIDGNTDEWDNKFQAYNHAIGCYYTIANDNNNLYIAIQSKDNNVTDKILAGGINITLSNPRKGGNHNASITYAVSPASARMRISDMKVASIRNHTVLNTTDLNEQLAHGGKEIDVKNLDSIPDGSLSIYNEYHIMAAMLYNDADTYSYELCIPLKYMRSYLNNSSVINYTIQLNGEDINGNNMAVRVNGVAQETLTPETKALINSVMATNPQAASMREMTSPTNFSGTYTLAKK